MGAALFVVALPLVSMLTATAAAAAPVLVQSASSSGSNAVPGSTVAITATLGSPCAAGDTLIAMVTVGEQVAAAGAVPVTPPGWQRLFEHAPSDTSPTTISPYQGWFALPGCTGISSATFSVTAPGDSAGTTGSVVVSEFSGLPDPLVVDVDNNAGNATPQTSGSLSGGPSPASSGELTLAALSFYGSSPSQTTPSGWNLAGSATSTMPAYTYWQVGNGSAPSASFSWSPSSAFEVTMLALAAGPAGGAPDVVQEAQGTFNGQSSWQVSLPAGVGTGDALVALIGTDASTSDGAGFEATGLAGGGVSWQQVAGYRQSGNGTGEVWVGFASAGTSGATPVTATLASGSGGNMVVSEVAGIAGIDRTSTNHGSGSTATASSLTPHAGDFLVGWLTTTSAVIDHPRPIWSTYSVSAASFAGEWQSDAAHASSSPQWQMSSGGSWLAVQAAFDVNPPIVTGVSPVGGLPAGGNQVTITGANFTGATGVSFGGAGAGFTVNSATSITATAPAASLGTVDVVVTSPNGTSATGPADQYTYALAPTVTGVSPATGPGSGGTAVTVTGTNLTGTSAVDFGPGNPGQGVVVNGGGTALTVTTPRGVGTVDVTVTANGITSATSSADRFAFVGAGYWMVGSDGGVFAFGTAPFVGSLPGLHVTVNDIVGVVPTADHKGYWMVGADGGVFAFGDAGFVGSLPGLKVHVSDIVGVVPTATGKGYWMVGADGGVFAFGDAGFVGSLPGLKVHVSDIVGVVPTATGKGYWMVGADGGVFAFGDAGFVGSLPGDHVAVNDIVGVVPTSSGRGYWMVGRDGGVFAFGDAGFLGSLPGLKVHVSDIVGVVPTHDNAGYWMVGADGGVFAFGDAGFVGSLPGLGVHVHDIVAVVPS
jgi:hypothetical protein